MRLRTTLVATVILSSATLWASDYLTHGVDPGRTGWMKDEKVFTTTNVGNMKLLWKVKLDSKPRAMHNLFEPLIVEKVTTAAGHARDGRRRRRHRRSLRHRRRDRPAAVAPALRQRAAGGPLARGRQRPLSGRPDRGAGDRPWRDARQVHGLRHFVGRPAAAGERRDGQDAAPPEKFLPGDGKPYALNLVNGVIYTATAQGCGGLPNAFYSFDLATRKASTFLPAGGGLWGRRGAAIDPEGRVYIGTGDARFDPGTKSLGNGIVAVKLDANKQLQLVDYFAPQNANWLWRRDLDVNTTPMVFDYQGRKFLVGTSKECRLWLLDRDDLGRRGSSHHARHHAAHLQRHAGVRRQGHLGRAVDVAGRRAARSGCWRRSGAR